MDIVLQHQMGQLLIVQLLKLHKYHWFRDSSFLSMYYGITGCGVFMAGIQNEKGFWRRKLTLKVKLRYFLTPPHYTNSQNSIISFDYSWFLTQKLSIFVFLPLENSTSGITIIVSIVHEFIRTHAMTDFYLCKLQGMDSV